MVLKAFPVIEWYTVENDPLLVQLSWTFFFLFSCLFFPPLPSRHLLWSDAGKKRWEGLQIYAVSRASLYHRDIYKHSSLSRATAGGNKGARAKEKINAKQSYSGELKLYRMVLGNVISRGFCYPGGLPDKYGKEMNSIMRVIFEGKSDQNKYN